MKQFGGPHGGHERLDDLVDLIEGARGVPLSDSCVINRTIALDLLEAVRPSCQASLRDAATILADRDDVLEDAAREAESRIAAAQDEADAILSRAENEVAALQSQAQADIEQHLAQGQADAARTVDRARAEAERLVAADTIRLEAERRRRPCASRLRTMRPGCGPRPTSTSTSAWPISRTPCGPPWTRSGGDGGGQCRHPQAPASDSGVYDFTPGSRRRWRSGRWAPPGNRQADTLGGMALEPCCWRARHTATRAPTSPRDRRRVHMCRSSLTRPLIGKPGAYQRLDLIEPAGPGEHAGRVVAESEPVTASGHAGVGA